MLWTTLVEVQLECSADGPQYLNQKDVLYWGGTKEYHSGYCGNRDTLCRVVPFTSLFCPFSHRYSVIESRYVARWLRVDHDLWPLGSRDGRWLLKTRAIVTIRVKINVYIPVSTVMFTHSNLNLVTRNLLGVINSFHSIYIIWCHNYLLLDLCGY